MIGGDAPSKLVAEYIATIAVARALHDFAPGRVRIERQIRSIFSTMPMKGYLSEVVPETLLQGRIDVVVATDEYHFYPTCLIEIKRRWNRSSILKDVERLERLLLYTKPNLNDLFAFCLFPITFKPHPTRPPDYNTPKNKLLAKIKNAVSLRQAAHQNLLIEMHDSLAGAYVERPSVVPESVDEFTDEMTWDDAGFRMEAVAICIERGVVPQ